MEIINKYMCVFSWPKKKFAFFSSIPKIVVLKWNNTTKIILIYNEELNLTTKKIIKYNTENYNKMFWVLWVIKNSSLPFLKMYKKIIIILTLHIIMLNVIFPSKMYFFFSRLMYKCN